MEYRAPSFQQAFSNLMIEEGGDKFVNDPADPGGATKYGVSLRFLKGLWNIADPDYIEIIGSAPPNTDTIRFLRKDQAEALAFRKFWKPSNCGRMPQDIAEAVFDFAYNASVRQAGRYLQRAINDVIADADTDALSKDKVEVDGWIGSRTILAVRSILEYEGDDNILAAFTNRRSAFYLKIAKRNPALTRFLKGWLRRAIAEDTPDLPAELAKASPDNEASAKE